MRLFTMWGVYPDSRECLDAWDESVVDENYEGYEAKLEELEKVARSHGGALRVVTVEIPNDEIDKALGVPVVSGSVV